MLCCQNSEGAGAWAAGPVLGPRTQGLIGPETVLLEQFQGRPLVDNGGQGRRLRGEACVSSWPRVQKTGSEEGAGGLVGVRLLVLTMPLILQVASGELLTCQTQFPHLINKGIR